MDYKSLNISRIYEKLADIKESMQILKLYGKQEDNAFLQNQEAVRSARYTFIVLNRGGHKHCQPYLRQVFR